MCLETVAYCLQTGDKHAEAAHIRLLLDCAELCQTNANFLLRGSDFTRICAVCAEVCEQCAQDCEWLGGDAKLKACADACRRCAESCRQMSTTARAA